MLLAASGVPRYRESTRPRPCSISCASASPGASLAVADLEDPLPFDAGEFDVVTAFNSVQYAADPVAALKNMSQVTKPGGLIGVVVWGPPAQCESGVLFTELGPLMPPAPPRRAGCHRLE
jgi:Methylase involved in ubiquinone/menaquinone biosynthesis